VFKALCTFIFIGLSFLSAPLWAEKTCNGEQILSKTYRITDAYRSLQGLGLLLNQNDPDLVTQCLAFENDGGLCASVAGLNSLRAILKYVGRDFEEDQKVYLKMMFDHLALTLDIDARRELSDHDLASGLAFLAEKLNLKLHFSFRRATSLQDYVAAPDEIVIATFYGRFYETQDSQGHDLVALSVDTTTGQFIFSDGNYPDVKIVSVLKEKTVADEKRFDLVPKKEGDFMGESREILRIRLLDEKTIAPPSIPFSEVHSLVGETVSIKWQNGLQQNVHLTSVHQIPFFGSLGIVGFKDIVVGDDTIYERPIEQIETIIKAPPRNHE
jgi:hypothetical protein